MQDVGKLLVLFGLMIVGVGILLIFLERLPFGLGRLPGDIVIRRDNLTFYFPIVTSIVLSVLLTVLFSVIIYLKK